MSSSTSSSMWPMSVALGVEDLVGVVEILRVEHFDRHPLRELDVPCLDHDAHAAASDETADLVLANLDRQTVLDLADDLLCSALRGASIMVSGILIEQQTEIVDRLSSLGLACVERREEEGWVAMKFLRPESCEGEA